MITVTNQLILVSVAYTVIVPKLSQNIKKYEEMVQIISQKFARKRKTIFFQKMRTECHQINASNRKILYKNAILELKNS